MRPIGFLVLGAGLLSWGASPLRAQALDARSVLSSGLSPRVLFVRDGDVAGLIKAIHLANADERPNVIQLPPGSTYTLNAVDNASAGANGLPVIRSAITIHGNGSRIQRSAEAGTPRFRLFRVDSEAALTLCGLTLENGLLDLPSSFDDGAGILNGGDTTLIDCTIRNNHASGVGGGISREFLGGFLTLTRCTVRGNSAERGGGIGGWASDSSGPVTLTDCLLEDNSATGYGGGIYEAGAKILMLRCLVRGNSAVGGGGGLYSQRPMLLTDCEVSGNSAGGGGGILGPVRAERCSIRDNEAEYDGGGVWVLYSGTLSECSLVGNKAFRNGGAIYVDGQGALVLDHSTIRANRSLDGGGLWVRSSAFLTYNALSDNAATRDGGALFLSPRAEQVTLHGCTLSGNGAGRDGGGLHDTTAIQGSKSTLLRNCTLSGNTAARDGGGILNDDLELELDHCTVSGNKALNAGGGILNRGTLSLGSTILANGPLEDCLNLGTVLDGGFNLVQDGSCIQDPTSTGGDPLLGPLANNGGPTRTHALLPGSPAIDGGDLSGATVTLDQRGFSRSPGTFSDVGAFEADASPCSIPAIVPAGDVAGLVRAIDCSNASPGPDSFGLADGGRYTLNRVDNDLDGPNGLPSISGVLKIQGHDAVLERSQEAGTPEFRLLHVAANGSLGLSGLAVTGGSSGWGGGIRNVGGSLTLVDCAVHHNGNEGVVSWGATHLSRTTIESNSGSYALGCFGPEPISLLDCTISNNLTEAAVSLGGYSDTVVSVTACTVSGNAGTGIYLGSDSNFVSLTNTTISENLFHGISLGLPPRLAPRVTNCTLSENGLLGISSGGDIAELSLSNSIVFGNGAGDCDTGYGLSLLDEGHNLIGDGTFLTHPTSLSGDPRLGPLADNGGPTKTRALLDGSPAIDAGDCAGDTVSVDQRGMRRPMGAACDMGAFEAQAPAHGSGGVRPGAFTGIR